MRSKVLRWGNSLGRRIPAGTAREMLLAAGSMVDLQLSRGLLVVRPVPGPATLESLLGRETREAGRRAAARSFSAWTPGRGDLVSVAADASETTGSPDDSPRRMALVVSPVAYSTKVGLAVVCAVTEEPKGYPFEVALPGELRVPGVVLADRVSAVDVRARGVRRVCRAPDEVTRKVLERLLALVG